MAKKSKSPQFRASDEEYAHINKAAQDAGMSRSDYLRALVLHPTVVVINGGDEIVLIPSTVTLADADERIRRRFAQILAGLNAEAAPTSPSEAGGTVGVSLPDGPPVPAEIAREPAGAAAGSIPGSGETPSSPPAQAAAVPAGPPSTAAAPQSASPPPPPVGGENLPVPGELDVVGACPDCGGRNGQHQGFCEQITGEPPVKNTEAATPPKPEGAPIETQAAFMERRTRELEADGRTAPIAQAEAAAEWRRIVGGTPLPAAPTAAQPAPQIEACYRCGAGKQAGTSCPECGARPL